MNRNDFLTIPISFYGQMKYEKKLDFKAFEFQNCRKIL